jgi:hypothetical protein
MNHALMRHSSERSGEEHDIEGSSTERQAWRARSHNACSQEVAGLLQAMARFDQLTVHDVNPDGAPGDRRVERGQAAIPTSDFENGGAPQINQTLDLARLDLLGVNPNPHPSPPQVNVCACSMLNLPPGRWIDSNLRASALRVGSVFAFW